mgnify:FL=1
MPACAGVIILGDRIREWFRVRQGIEKRSDVFRPGKPRAGAATEENVGEPRVVADSPCGRPRYAAHGGIFVARRESNGKGVGEREFPAEEETRKPSVSRR